MAIPQNAAGIAVERLFAVDRGRLPRRFLRHDVESLSRKHDGRQKSADRAPDGPGRCNETRAEDPRVAARESRHSSPEVPASPRPRSTRTAITQSRRQSLVAEQELRQRPRPGRWRSSAGFRLLARLAADRPRSAPGSRRGGAGRLLPNRRVTGRSTCAAMAANVAANMLAIAQKIMLPAITAGFLRQVIAARAGQCAGTWILRQPAGPIAPGTAAPPPA